MTDAISATAPDVTPRLRPATERILAALPGSRLLWIVLWALVPWVNAGANLLLDTGESSAIWEQSRALVILNYAALSVAVVITLWGTARIARRVKALRATTLKVLEGGSREPFREMNGVLVPLVAVTATATAFAVTALVRDGWTAAILRGATWLVLGIALWTFLWTYASLQLGLDRLGREHLLPVAAHVDPSLGLRPLGDVAFMGLWMLLAWLVPVLLTGLSEVVGVVIGMLVLAAGLATFFFSLLRLHRQMAAVKASELALARDLYAQAYEPVRAEPSLDALSRQQSLLGAAGALETRALAIHEWPIDEGTWARVVTIATSVTAITVARLILDPLGL
jgi:hypothetical protein